MGVSRDRPGLAFGGTRQELSAVLGSVDSRADFSSYLTSGVNCVSSFSDRGVVRGTSRELLAGRTSSRSFGWHWISLSLQAGIILKFTIYFRKERKEKEMAVT